MAKRPTPKVITKKHLARVERERRQNRNLMIGAITILVLVVLLILYGVLDQNVLQKNRPVAKVGSEVITTGQFQTQVRYTRFRMIDTLAQMAGNQLYQQFFGSYIQQLQTQLSNPNQLGQQVLTQMVDDKTIAIEAKKMGISVSDAEVDQQIQENFGFYVNGTPTPTVTPTPWNTPTLNPTQLVLVPPTATPTITPTGPTPTNTLEPGAPTPTVGDTPTPEPTATNTPPATATPAESPTPTLSPTPLPTETPYTQQGFETNYNDYLTQLKSIGFTQDDLRQLVRDQLLRTKVTKEVTKDVKPVQEQVWARHILVATQAEAEAARQRLMNGETFAKVAADVSTDTSNNTTGGDLGWFTRSQMIKEFSDAAFSMKVGEISQPVQTTEGWHIIQVLGHEERPLTADQLQQAQQVAFQDWLTAREKELDTQTYDRWTQVVPTDPTVPPELLSPATGQ